VDSLSKAQRSALMARVRQRNTSPELIVRKALHARGFRYVLNDRRLPGTPDLTLPKWRVAVFVHGCFWHGHGCPKSRLPSTNRSFWTKKVRDNRNRDQLKEEQLRLRGWRVLVVWECDLRDRTLLEQYLDVLAGQIRHDTLKDSIRRGHRTFPTRAL
jgi:DNA mismatch endonuclease, patch repair protein